MKSLSDKLSKILLCLFIKINEKTKTTSNPKIKDKILYNNGKLDVYLLNILSLNIKYLYDFKDHNKKKKML